MSEYRGTQDHHQNNHHHDHRRQQQQPQQRPRRPPFVGAGLGSGELPAMAASSATAAKTVKEMLDVRSDFFIGVDNREIGMFPNGKQKWIQLDRELRDLQELPLIADSIEIDPALDDAHLYMGSSPIPVDPYETYLPQLHRRMVPEMDPATGRPTGRQVEEMVDVAEELGIRHYMGSDGVKRQKFWNAATQTWDVSDLIERQADEFEIGNPLFSSAEEAVAAHRATVQSQKKRLGHDPLVATLKMQSIDEHGRPRVDNTDTRDPQHWLDNFGYAEQAPGDIGQQFIDEQRAEQGLLRRVRQWAADLNTMHRGVPEATLDVYPAGKAVEVTPFMVAPSDNDADMDEGAAPMHTSSSFPGDPIPSAMRGDVPMLVSAASLVRTSSLAERLASSQHVPMPVNPSKPVLATRFTEPHIIDTLTEFDVRQRGGQMQLRREMAPAGDSKYEMRNGQLVRVSKPGAKQMSAQTRSILRGNQSQQEQLRLAGDQVARETTGRAGADMALGPTALLAPLPTEPAPVPTTVTNRVASAFDTTMTQPLASAIDDSDNNNTVAAQVDDDHHHHHHQPPPRRRILVSKERLRDHPFHAQPSSSATPLDAFDDPREEEQQFYDPQPSSSGVVRCRPYLHGLKYTAGVMPQAAGEERVHLPLHRATGIHPVSAQWQQVSSPYQQRAAGPAAGPIDGYAEQPVAPAATFVPPTPPPLSTNGGRPPASSSSSSYTPPSRHWLGLDTGLNTTTHSANTIVTGRDQRATMVAPEVREPALSADSQQAWKALAAANPLSAGNRWDGAAASAGMMPATEPTAMTTSFRRPAMQPAPVAAQQLPVLQPASDEAVVRALFQHDAVQARLPDQGLSHTTMQQKRGDRLMQFVPERRTEHLPSWSSSQHRALDGGGTGQHHESSTTTGRGLGSHSVLESTQHLVASLTDNSLLPRQNMHVQQPAASAKWGKFADPSHPDKAQAAIRTVLTSMMLPDAGGQDGSIVPRKTMQLPPAASTPHAYWGKFADTDQNRTRSHLQQAMHRDAGIVHPDTAVLGPREAMQAVTSSETNALHWGKFADTGSSTTRSELQLAMHRQGIAHPDTAALGPREEVREALPSDAPGGGGDAHVLNWGAFRDASADANHAAALHLKSFHDPHARPTEQAFASDLAAPATEKKPTWGALADRWMDPESRGKEMHMMPEELRLGARHPTAVAAEAVTAQRLELTDDRIRNRNAAATAWSQSWTQPSGTQTPADGGLAAAMHAGAQPLLAARNNSHHRTHKTAASTHSIDRQGVEDEEILHVDALQRSEKYGDRGEGFFVEPDDRVRDRSTTQVHRPGMSAARWGLHAAPASTTTHAISTAADEGTAEAATAAAALQHTATLFAEHGEVIQPHTGLDDMNRAPRDPAWTNLPHYQPTQESLVEQRGSRLFGNLQQDNGSTTSSSTTLLVRPTHPPESLNQMAPAMQAAPARPGSELMPQRLLPSEGLLHVVNAFTAAAAAPVSAVHAAAPEMRPAFTARSDGLPDAAANSGVGGRRRGGGGGGSLDGGATTTFLPSFAQSGGGQNSAAAAASSVHREGRVVQERQQWAAAANTTAMEAATDRHSESVVHRGPSRDNALSAAQQQLRIQLPEQLQDAQDMAGLQVKEYRNEAALSRAMHDWTRSTAVAEMLSHPASRQHQQLDTARPREMAEHGVAQAVGAISSSSESTAAFSHRLARMLAPGGLGDAATQHTVTTMDDSLSEEGQGQGRGRTGGGFSQFSRQRLGLGGNPAGDQDAPRMVGEMDRSANAESSNTNDIVRPLSSKRRPMLSRAISRERLATLDAQMALGQETSRPAFFARSLRSVNSNSHLLQPPEDPFFASTPAGHTKSSHDVGEQQSSSSWGSFSHRPTRISLV